MYSHIYFHFPNQLQLRGYIEPLWHGSSRDLRAVDIDDGRVAVGYEDAIVIWDVESKREVKTISWENEHLVELHFDNKQQKILVSVLILLKERRRQDR